MHITERQKRKNKINTHFNKKNIKENKINPHFDKKDRKGIMETLSFLFYSGEMKSRGGVE